RAGYAAPAPTPYPADRLVPRNSTAARPFRAGTVSGAAEPTCPASAAGAEAAIALRCGGSPRVPPTSRAVPACHAIRDATTSAAVFCLMSIVAEGRTTTYRSGGAPGNVPETLD